MSGSQQTNTEDSILNNIPDFQGADDGGTDGGSTTQDTSQSGGGQSSAAPTNTAGAVDASGGVGSGANNTNQPANNQQPIVRRHDGLIEKPNANNPNTRDLVDPITGQIVAQGGIERRVFEQAQRATRELATTKQQLDAATTRLNGVDQVIRVANDLQISPENHVAALRVMSDFLKDPVKTLEMLVAEVKGKGYQIPFLTAGISPGIDMQAIGRMIDGKMQPITQQQQLEQQNQVARDNAKKTLDGFLETHPEANANLGTIAEMLQARPGLTLSDAYIEMMKWSNANGLDYTQPLAAQIQARNTTNTDPNNQQPTNQQPNQPQGRPLPQGRSAASSAAPIGATTQYNENSSWADIIKSSLNESGFNLN